VEVHYTVRAGDTLWTIAQRHDATTDQLVTWNRLPRSGEHVHLAVGQRLVVGHGEGAASGQGRIHVLQPGETLWALSRRYGTSVDDLRALNGIDDVRNLRVGQVLVVER
jgi:LysM repeat protein